MDMRKANLFGAVAAWEIVQKELAKPNFPENPDRVEACLTALTGTIPNFLSWAGIDDFKDGKFWESPAAKEALNLPPEADFENLVLGLEGLKLKAAADSLSAKFAALKKKQGEYLARACAAGVEEPAGNTALLGDKDFVQQAARTVVPVLEPSV